MVFVIMRCHSAAAFIAFLQLTRLLSMYYGLLPSRFGRPPQVLWQVDCEFDSCYPQTLTAVACESVFARRI